MNLSVTLKSLFDTALLPLLPDAAKRAEALNTLVVSGKPEFGDYQLKCAMSLGKALGQKPQDVAKTIVDNLPANDLIASAVVAGPGFINITLQTKAIADLVQIHAADDRLGVAKLASPKKYVIDYSGPNVAKPLHVGHLRSTIIGDALVRILRHLGHTVVGDNHLGDWGTQFGILLYGYKNLLNAEAYKTDPVQELERLYIEVRKLFVKKDDEDDEAPTADPVKEACRAETAKLHAGDMENNRLWNEFMPACLEMLKPIYARLDVQIDHALGESFYNPMLPGVVESLLKSGVAVESQGAVVVPNAKGVIPQTAEEQTTEEPPALVRKRDGAFTYTTTDMATIRYRVDTWQPDEILYVVDARQALHFKTLFASAKRWIAMDVKLHHLPFGSVLDADGKPFAARKGGAPKLSDLLDQAAARGLQKYEENCAARREQGHEVPELTAERKQEIAEVVGYGAVKYADLSGNRTSDYKFDLERMLATNGNTATYMQYGYARSRAIFRKGEVDFDSFPTTGAKLHLEHSAERALGLKLLQFEDAILEAALKYEPHHITTYLWELAKSFSSFFESCPVLTAPTEEVKASRLLLVQVTGRTIQAALGLLGIRTVEQM